MNSFILHNSMSIDGDGKSSVKALNEISGGLQKLNKLDVH